MVWAGADATNPSQGGVVICEPAYGQQCSPLYPTPRRAGRIRVEEQHGRRLVLRAEDGTLFYFDVDLRQFVLTP
jgi:hypothetical protein